MTPQSQSFVVILPAAGVGKRMQAQCPKQYLPLNGTSLLEQTVERILSHPLISHIVMPLSKDDGYFASTSLVNNPRVKRVDGGKERVDSVLNGLKDITSETYPWVLVHDAARPCLTHEDIDKLISACVSSQQGGLLAYPVRDTMKQSNSAQTVESTIDRSKLWHALTPQMYKTQDLYQAIVQSQTLGVEITDESSAIEAIGLPSQLVEGRSDNIKVTRPDDLLMAEFILQNQVVTSAQTEKEK